MGLTVRLILAGKELAPVYHKRGWNFDSNDGKGASTTWSGAWTVCDVINRVVGRHGTEIMKKYVKRFCMVVDGKHEYRYDAGATMDTVLGGARIGKTAKIEICGAKQNILVSMVSSGKSFPMFYVGGVRFTDPLGKLIGKLPAKDGVRLSGLKYDCNVRHRIVDVCNADLSVALRIKVKK